MDTLLFPQPSDFASELSLNELTPVTSSEGDYAQVPFSPTDLQAQPFPYDTEKAHNLYQQQQFNNLHYQSTQSLFPIDTTQPWTLSTQQQSYTAMTSSSLPVQPMNAPLSATSTPSSSFMHGYVPLAKWPTIASSIHSTLSDGEEQPNPDSTSERRRQRRRAQNRVAQRAFRARKEETIKESSARLSTLQAELTQLQANNTTLSSTVNTLRARIAFLQCENTQLKRHSMGNIDVDSANLDPSAIHAESEGVSPALVPPPLTTADSHDSGVYDVGTIQHPESPVMGSDDEAASATDRYSAAVLADAITDAAAVIADAIADAAAALRPGDKPLLQRTGRPGPEHMEAEA